MQSSDFASVLADTFQQIEKVLGAKAAEYAKDDRLNNFKTVASLRGVTPSEALAGMMAKHTVSIYDMIGSKEQYSPEMWDEKIFDHINYLILLRACLYDDSVSGDPIHVKKGK